MQYGLEGYNWYDHVINVEQVFDAIHKLKKEKSDGGKGLWSNHLIYAPHIFKVHIDYYWHQCMSMDITMMIC